MKVLVSVAVTLILVVVAWFAFAEFIKGVL